MRINFVKKTNEKISPKVLSQLTPEIRKLLDTFTGKYEETFEKGLLRFKAYTDVKVFGPQDVSCYFMIEQYARIGGKWVPRQDILTPTPGSPSGVMYYFRERNSKGMKDCINFPGRFGNSLKEAVDYFILHFKFFIEEAAEEGMDKAECEKCLNDLAENTQFITQAFVRMEKHLPELYTIYEDIQAAAEEAVFVQRAPVEIKKGQHKGGLIYTAAAKSVAQKLGEDLLMAILAAASDEAFSQADEYEWKDAVDVDHSLEWNTCQALGWGFDDMSADAPFKGESGKVYSGDEARKAYDAISELNDDDRYSLFFNNQPRNYRHIRDVVATALDMAAGGGDDEDW